MVGRWGGAPTQWVVALAVMATAACSLGTQVESGPVGAVLDDSGEVAMRVGDDVVIQGTVLRLGVTDVVGDSRCPVDVACVWAGDTEVEIAVALGMGPSQPRSVHFNAEAGDTSTEIGGYRVTLVGVQPEARSDQTIDAEEYRLRFRVEEVG